MAIWHSCMGKFRDTGIPAQVRGKKNPAHVVKPRVHEKKVFYQNNFRFWGCNFFSVYKKAHCAPFLLLKFFFVTVGYKNNFLPTAQWA
jgi:hypothetical protein